MESRDEAYEQRDGDDEGNKAPTTYEIESSRAIRLPNKMSAVQIKEQDVLDMKELRIGI